jgi:hypothetical protein
MSMKQKVNVTNWHAVGREGSKKMGNNLSMLLSIIISYTQRYKPCCSSFGTSTRNLFRSLQGNSEKLAYVVSFHNNQIHL